MRAINLLPILTLVVAAGCANPTHSIVGNWTYDQAPANVDFRITFAGDGTWSQTNKDDKSSLVASGTYKYENDSITMNQTDGQDMGGFRSGRKEWSSKVRWLSDDLMEISDLQPPTQYKRKK